MQGFWGVEAARAVAPPGLDPAGCGPGDRARRPALRTSSGPQRLSPSPRAHGQRAREAKSPASRTLLGHDRRTPPRNVAPCRPQAFAGHGVRRSRYTKVPPSLAPPQQLGAKVESLGVHVGRWLRFRSRSVLTRCPGSRSLSRSGGEPFRSKTVGDYSSSGSAAAHLLTASRTATTSTTTSATRSAVKRRQMSPQAPAVLHGCQP
jgi:hypothetical protein